MQHLQHPLTPVNGIPAEDVFLVMDDLGSQVGMGYVVCQFQQHLDPDCPINIYASLESASSARYLLSGALVARARQMRDMNPNARARVYTAVRVDDEAQQAFYRENGWNLEHTEVRLKLNPAAAENRFPMGSVIREIPLNTQEEQMGLLSRMAANDVTHLDMGFLFQVMRTPHFRALGMTRGNQILAEAVVAGNNKNCELLAVYVSPESRMQGIGKALVSHLMTVMASEGATEFTVRMMTRSAPQMALSRAFSPETLDTLTVFPELSL